MPAKLGIWSPRARNGPHSRGESEMMTKFPLILAAISTLALSACVDPNAPMGTQTRQGATIGGLTGAVLGAATASDGNELRGALIGGALGAGSGAVIGSALDRQAAELRSTLPSYITIANNGEFLVVNMPQDLLFETGQRRPSPRTAAGPAKHRRKHLALSRHADRGDRPYRQHGFGGLQPGPVAAPGLVRRERPSRQRRSVQPAGDVRSWRRAADRLEPDGRRTHSEPPGRDHHSPDPLILPMSFKGGRGHLGPLFHCASGKVVIISDQSLGSTMPFQKVAPEKLSQSVVRQIEELILRGILRPGERLPSERDLCRETGRFAPVSAGGDRENWPRPVFWPAVQDPGSSSLKFWDRPSHPPWCGCLPAMKRPSSTTSPSAATWRGWQPNGLRRLGSETDLRVIDDDLSQDGSRPPEARPDGRGAAGCGISTWRSSRPATT